MDQEEEEGRSTGVQVRVPTRESPPPLEGEQEGKGRGTTGGPTVYTEVLLKC